VPGPSSLNTARSQQKVGLTPSRGRIAYRTKAVLAQIFGALIDADFSWPTIEEFAKAALIAAAMPRATRRSGSVNQSAIAASTGLSRKDVARLVRRANTAIESNIRLGHATQVAAAWSSERGYTTRAGRPKLLSLSPHAEGGFQDLARRFGRDTPTRALLSRMVSLGMVERVSRAQGGQFVRLVRPTPSDSTLRALRARLDIVMRLTDPAEAAHPGAGAKTIRIPAHTQGQMLSLIGLAMSRRDRFLDALASAPAPSTNGATPTAFVEVTVLVQPRARRGRR
jgi:hypothetical protein